MATGDDHRSAADYLPRDMGLASLRRAAAGCRGCELYARATQTVFGEGPAHAAIICVGEQPGDSEDRAGHPFVGPAGRLLDSALAAAGIPRSDVYVTNAVKHFSWTPRGKKRIHKKPTQYQVRACHPWLQAELEAVSPDIVVLMGATAAQSIFGPRFRVTRSRGQILATALGPVALVTVHPSAVLRIPDDEARRAARRELFSDFQAVADHRRGLVAAAHPAR